MIWEEYDAGGKWAIGKSNDLRVSRWAKRVGCVAINWDVELGWEGGYSGW